MQQARLKMYILINTFYDYRSDISVLDISLIIIVLFRYAWAPDSATINCIIFWDFLMFYQSLLSPQVKRCAIITYKHGIYKFPNDLRLSLVSISQPSAQSPCQIENFAGGLGAKPPPAGRHPTRIPQPAPNTPPAAAHTATPRPKNPTKAFLQEISIIARVNRKILHRN